MKVPKYSPWGKVDHHKQVADGIMEISTPGHGGFKLDRKRNALVPAPLRRKGGWYEEDCEWGIVALVFPEVLNSPYNSMTLDGVRAMVKDYFPHQYTEAFGETVSLEESIILRREKFKQDTKEKMVVCSAIGRGDKVHVHAERASTGERAQFLVPADEYARRPGISSGGGFIVDETRHERIA